MMLGKSARSHTASVEILICPPYSSFSISPCSVYALGCSSSFALESIVGLGCTASSR